MFIFKRIYKNTNLQENLPALCTTLLHFYIVIGEQNHREECYGEDPSDDYYEDQYNIQLLSLDQVTSGLVSHLLSTFTQ